MGSSQSCGACDLKRNKNTKSKSYVEELLQIKQANFCNLNSIESKEVLQSRRERILKVLKDRKPIKPYAMQLLEARAAAQSELSITDNLQDPVDAQSKNLPAENTRKEPDHKSRILQRFAARRRSKRPVNTSPSPTSNASPADTANSLPTSAVEASPVKTIISTSTSISLSPSVNTLTPPSSNRATQSDPPAQVSVLSKASQSSSLGSFVDSAIQVTPIVEFSPQKTVRLSEPKIYVQPPTPALPKIFASPPIRLSNQPPPTVRQSICAAFSRPNPSSELLSSMATSSPFINDLENVCKEKLNQNKLPNRGPALLDEKRIYSDNDPVPLMSSRTKLISGQKLQKLVEEQRIAFERDDTYQKRHTAAVDKLTDSLMANWMKKNSSAELLGANDKELSLLTYSESKRTVVPHFPIREKDRVSKGYTNHDGALKLNDSLPSVRFGKSRSRLHCESMNEKRCMRHRDNKI